ncbi:MAG: zinc ribbon domain-containing protein [Promethearchaeota archaeon]
MTLLYQAAGFFSEGEMKMVQYPGVHYAKIDITTDGLTFEGQNVTVPATGFTKNSAGVHIEIPWKDISSAYKTKRRVMHVVKIETYSGKFYTIIPLDDLKHFIKQSKKNSIALAETINKARSQVESSQLNLCPKCGKPLKPDSDFCGDCGHKLK